MIINADANALEVRVAAYFFQDKVLMQELIDEVDIHTDNQQKFGLPSRLLAKVLKFRTIYGGNEHSFALDPEFAQFGDKQYWKNALDAYFKKYQGIYKGHISLIQQATTTGKITTQTGRSYRFKPDPNGKWPVTCIKNYPVQGLAADIMALARISVFNRLKKFNYGERALLINSVHDSIMLDVDNDPELIYNISMMLEQAFLDVPVNFEKIFGTPFNVPMKAEVEFGFNWKEMLKFDRSNKQAIKDLLNKENK